MSRCPTTSGPHRCEKDINHQGECEARAEPVRPLVIVPAAASSGVAATRLRCPTCDQPMPEKTP